MSTEQAKNTPGNQPLPDYGFLAEYSTTTDLVHAAEKVRDAGYTKWDCYSPFPVHGIDPAMGIKATILPWVVLGGGLTGCFGGLLMQWWMNAVDYPYLISGKPFWSIPANIPVAFELTILLSAFAAFGSVLLLNNLPDWFHPLFRSKRFARVTDDKFFLAIEATDPKFSGTTTRNLLEGTKPVAIEMVEDESGINAAIPRPIHFTGGILTCLAIVPLCIIAMAYISKSEKPRIHLNPNMDHQVKFKTQLANPLFADGRAMRPAIDNTVATGESRENDHLYRGLSTDGGFAATFPDEVPVNTETMDRGEKVFNIYCSTCHGYTGDGKGMTHLRASSLNQGTWVPPSSLHLDYLKAQPHGQLFNTITHGVRNMKGYGHLIDVEDRWAVVLYIRALQRSQQGTLEDVPTEKRAALD